MGNTFGQNHSLAIGQYCASRMLEGDNTDPAIQCHWSRIEPELQHWPRKLEEMFQLDVALNAVVTGVLVCQEKKPLWNLETSFRTKYSIKLFILEAAYSGFV
jgi:hypothetical protein